MSGTTADVISKRLHVAGLTPAITSKDLQDRFSSFGKVTAVDGIGLLDGNGMPRPFGYVTVESTEQKLTRCMNLLSGSTWKGAKLRIGEAKPDWRERHAVEVGLLRSKRGVPEEDEPLSSKKRKLSKGTVGREAKDMTPVSLDNVADRSGWKVTVLKHIYRPVRMRPLHPIPLPQTLSTTATIKPKGKEKIGKKRKRKEKPAPTRAWRVVLDPARYGAVHVTGSLLESSAIAALARSRPSSPAADEEEAVQEDEDMSSGDSNMDERKALAFEPLNSAPTVPSSVPPLKNHRMLLPADFRKPALDTPGTKSGPAAELLVDFLAEKATGLSLLKGMFGDGLEGADMVAAMEGAVDSDDDIAKHRDWKRQKASSPKEEVMQEADSEEEESEEKDMRVNAEEEEEEEEEESEASIAESKAQSVAERPAGAPKQTLKDLFAPREDPGGFALDLDLDELDEDPSLLPTALPSAPAAFEAPPQTFTSSSTKEDLFSMPFFFPTFDEDGNGIELVRGGRRQGRAKTFWDVAKEKEWNLQSWKKETEEEARARWEEVKGPLTTEWKLRWKEAKKSRKRRGGMIAEN